MVVLYLLDLIDNNRVNTVLHKTETIFTVCK